ncbi:titin [Caerostris extrusa]|uniref:Titin n=1 Tax=Caerostris extrusa TaxID=172846 RepID=A0AAV4QIA6_CAEEX|nr:titin [Caerostris extrusa]
MITNILLLILDPVSLEDNANYTCKATNSFGHDQYTAYLNVKESPVIEKFQFKENVKEGDFVSVLCIVNAGTQPITFTWYKNGEEFVAFSKDVTIENSPISSVLALNSVTSKSNGNYTCTAKNNFGSDHHSTTLKVKASPIWVEQSKNITTILGETVNTHCKAAGSPDPHIFWRKYLESGASVDIGKKFLRSSKNDTVLDISKVSYGDAGIYEVRCGQRHSAQHQFCFLLPFVVWILFIITN